MLISGKHVHVVTGRATFHTFEISHKARARDFVGPSNPVRVGSLFRMDDWPLFFLVVKIHTRKRLHRLQHRTDDIQWARHSSCNWINNILFYWYDSIVSILGYFLVKNSAPKTIACSETGPMKGWRGKCCIWPKLQHHERESEGVTRKTSLFYVRRITYIRLAVWEGWPAPTNGQRQTRLLLCWLGPWTWSEFCQMNDSECFAEWHIATEVKVVKSFLW